MEYSGKNDPILANVLLFIFIFMLWYIINQANSREYTLEFDGKFMDCNTSSVTSGQVECNNVYYRYYDYAKVTEKTK